MKIEIFSLCDAATESGGKLNLLGAFDAIGVREAPAAHPHCSVALRIRFQRIEAGPHRVRLGIVDADGRPVVPALDTGLQIRFAPEADSAVANLVWNLQGLRLPSFGRYSIDLALDGRQEGSLPLYVRPIQQPREEKEPT